MKSDILLFTLLISMPVYPQKIRQDSSSNFSFGADVSIDYYFKNPGTRFGNPEYYYILNEGKINYSFGIRTDFRISPSFTFGSGLYFSIKDMRMNYYCGTCTIPNPNFRSPQQGICYGPFIAYLEYPPEYLNIKYLAFPVKGKYYIIKDNPWIFLNAGFNSYLLVSKINANKNDVLFSRTLLTYCLGTGITFIPLKNLEMDIGIEFEKLLTDFKKSTDPRLNSVKVNMYFKPWRF